MKRTVRRTLKLFAWLSLIVAFASYSVTPAFARMPRRGSTTSENSRFHDHTTHTKIVLPTKQHSARSLTNLGELQIIDLRTLSTGGEFNKSSLSAEQLKALKSALSKAATESLHNHLGELQIIDFKTLSSAKELNKRSLTAKEIKALKNAVSTAAAAKGCTMLEEGDSWWGCMKGCLADVGVTPYSLIICGATCFTPATLVCAICLGVTVAVIEACGVGCALYAN